MTLTAEQIAEKMFPESGHNVYRKRAALTSLIRDLQKQTWDQACKAMKEKAMDECGDYLVEFTDMETDRVGHLIHKVELPPIPENL